MSEQFKPGDLVRVKAGMLDSDFASEDLRDLRGLCGLVLARIDRPIDEYTREEDLERCYLVVNWVIDGESWEYTHFRPEQWLNRVRSSAERPPAAQEG